MKIAYFSPLPPQRTGIADYSADLLPALIKRAEVDLWVDHSVDARALPECRLFTYADEPGLLRELEDYDAIIYHMGNSPAHRRIFPVLLEHPGIVVLHDFVLHHFLAGYYLEERGSPALYVEEMAYNYGSAGAEVARSALRSRTPIWEQEPLRYPLNKRVLDCARGVIVHSEFALRMVRQSHAHMPVKKINLPTPVEKSPAGAAELKRRYNIPADTIVIASFGSANPSKMTFGVARAVAAMGRKNVIYLVVGEIGEQLQGQAKAQFGELMRITGYVDKKTFTDYCNLIDIGIDLRYQTMGESSAGVCRILAAGKPCVVSNFGWFAEIPEDCAVKLDTGADEATLARCLSDLADDPGRRRRLGEAARAYVRSRHDVDQAADDYVQFVGEVRDLERSRGVRRALVEATGRAMAELGVGQDDDWLIGGIAREIESLFKPGS